MRNVWLRNQTCHFCVTSLEINFTIYFISNKFLIEMSFSKSSLTKLTSEFLTVIGMF